MDIRNCRFYILCLFSFFSIFLNAQEEVSSFSKEENLHGRYRLTLVRTIRPFESKQLYYTTYELLQLVLDSSWTNDRVAIKVKGKDKDSLYLTNMQNRDTFYTKLNDSCFMAAKASAKELRNNPALFTENLRLLFHLANNDPLPDKNRGLVLHSLDTTEYDGYTNIVSARLSEKEKRITGYVRKWQVIGIDTLYRGYEISGERLSAEAFEEAFAQERKKIKNIVEEPTAMDKANVPEKEMPKQLSDSLFQLFVESAINLKEIKNSDEQQPYLLYFYFNGCLPCLFVKPYLAEITEKDLARLIVVNTNDTDSAAIFQNLEKHGIKNVSVVLLGKELREIFQVSGVPKLLLYDPGKQLIMEKTGYDEDFLKKLMEKLEGKDF